MHKSNHCKEKIEGLRGSGEKNVSVDCTEEKNYFTFTFGQHLKDCNEILTRNENICVLRTYVMFHYFMCDINLKNSFYS